MASTQSSITSKLLRVARHSVWSTFRSCGGPMPLRMPGTDLWPGHGMATCINSPTMLLRNSKPLQHALQLHLPRCLCTNLSQMSCGATQLPDD